MNLQIEQFDTNLDIFDIYAIYKNDKNIILLDSNNNDKTLSQYSFLGVNPYKVVKGNKDRCYVDDKLIKSSVFDVLEKILKEDKPTNINYSPHSSLPFMSGCMGYLSYNLGYDVENVTKTAKDDFDIYDYYFVFYDNIIIFDLINDKKYITSLGVLNDSEKSINEILKNIDVAKKVPYTEVFNYDKQYTSNFTKEQYKNTVTKVKDYIKSGDIYIMNLTQRLLTTSTKSSFHIYNALRNSNPAPFSALLKLDDLEVISSSPERFLQIKDNIVQTRPIKGTVPRGKTIEEDEANRLKLQNSEKDKSELLMVVDLERNDLSKVCKPFTVQVPSLYDIEEYETVFHLVSTVEGELKDNVSSPKCLNACFPGGSITGTPKIRAMEILDELEQVSRGIYTGCIGYFDFNGNADFNIVIRTLVKKDDTISIGVGGGITWDSEKSEEYQETLDKAMALLRVL